MHRVLNFEIKSKRPHASGIAGQCWRDQKGCIEMPRSISKAEDEEKDWANVIRLKLDWQSHVILDQVLRTLRLFCLALASHNTLGV